MGRLRHWCEQRLNACHHSSCEASRVHLTAHVKQQIDGVVCPRGFT